MFTHQYYSHQIVSLLVSKGANPNLQDQQLQTPLHLSAKRGHFQSSEALIKAGADVSMKDIEGKTPLLGMGCQ